MSPFTLLDVLALVFGLFVGFMLRERLWQEQ